MLSLLHQSRPPEVASRAAWHTEVALMAGIGSIAEGVAAVAQRDSVQPLPSSSAGRATGAGGIPGSSFSSARDGDSAGPGDPGGGAARAGLPGGADPDSTTAFSAVDCG